MKKLPHIYRVNIYDQETRPALYFLRYYTPTDDADAEEDHELVTLKHQITNPSPQKFREALKATFSYLRKHPRDADVRWALVRRADLAYVSPTWEWRHEEVFESCQEIKPGRFVNLRIGDQLEELAPDNGTPTRVQVVHRSPGRTHIHVSAKGENTATDYSASSARTGLRLL